MGTSHACGLRADNGEAYCWGTSSDGAVNSTPTGVAFDTLSVGGRGNCGIRSDNGRVQCWGYNGNGLVSQAPTSTAFVAVANSDEGCAVRADNGRVVCWGGPSTSFPVALAPAGVALESVAMHNTVACGRLASSGRQVCWGEYTHNPLFMMP